MLKEAFEFKNGLNQIFFFWLEPVACLFHAVNMNLESIMSFELSQNRTLVLTTGKF